MNKSNILKELLKEAKERGFVPGIMVPGSNGEECETPLTTYKCAKSKKDCKLYFMPTEYIYNNHHKGALTDGNGGYIYYNGKWAENTTPSFLRDKKLKILGIQ